MITLCYEDRQYQVIVNCSEDNLRLSSTLPRPSKLAQAVFLELKGTQIRSSMESGTNVGRNDRV